MFCILIHYFELFYSELISIKL